ncbi:MAG: tungstate ABC transporter substrate-binding protein WtpA [Chloroflexota bacterium]|nr:tungstate ABC transporter substrate-binding protein WtpA [Chloroflexota bacterium]
MKKLYCLILALALSACTLSPGEKTQLRVLLAGSLIVPFDDLESAFEEQHPDVDVLIDAHGSIQCVRHVTELDGLADVVAVADYALVPMLMYETQDPETGQPYATWTLQFATNRLGIAYTPQSAHADEISADNWYEILSRPDVLLGLSDPRFDACGYRGLMLAHLAGSHYGVQDIFADLFGSRFTYPVRVQTSGDVSTIPVPEVLQPEKESGLVMRGSSVRLLALLQSGDLDYAFEYESVTRQHGLEFLPLPPEIDLSDKTYQDNYERVRVSLNFQRFASVNPEFEGQAIAYGLTIPANAPHPDLAVEFIQFLAGPEGQAIMAESQHPMILPPVADNKDALPAALQTLVK